MAVSVQTVCPQLDARATASDRTVSETQLNQICQNLVFNDGDAALGIPGYNLSDSELNSSLQRINGEEVQATQQQVGSVRATQIANLASRMDAIRAGLAQPGLSLAGLTLDDGEAILAAGYQNEALAAEGYPVDRTDALSMAAGDTLTGQGGPLDAPIWDKLGFFVTGGGKFGDKSSSGKVTGYDFYSVGLTVGADYRLQDDLVLGSAIGYSYYDVDFDSNRNSASGQDLDSNSVFFSLFGTYFPSSESVIPLEGFFIDGLASFGWSWFDLSRRIIVPSNNPAVPSIDEKAKGDTDAFQYGFAGNVGYEFNIGGFTLTPVGRVQYVKADISSYEESGASPVNLKVGSQDVKSLTTNAGLSLGYAFSTKHGVFEPSIRGEYVHEFENDDNGAQVRYASDPTGFSTFDVITEGANENYGIVGAALTGTFANGWSGFADFETVVDYGRFDIYALRAGFRKEF